MTDRTGLTRRGLMRAGAALSTASMGASMTEASWAETSRAGAAEAARGPAAPDDEAYWARVAARYEMTDRITNLENGNWGVMAQPVLEAYQEHTRRVNRENSYFARRAYAPVHRAVVEETAARLGVKPGEVALTRGATEALQNIIGGYNRLKPGEAVMIADLDYGSIRATMRGLARRHGGEVVDLAIPEPASHVGLIAFYGAALDDHPNTRLLLLTHVSHRTGLVMPVAEITALARARGVDVVVDAAHAWGQIDYTLPEIGADFVGLNLHKWIGAPVGVGAMYIAEARLADIDPNISAADHEADRIEGRVHTGTSNFAAFMSVPDAFAFQDAVGPAAKEARLRYLRGLWTSACREAAADGALDILTPEDARLHAGITSFRIAGRASVEDNKAIAAFLLDEFNVFSVHRAGVAGGACVRITPALYNGADDLARAADAILAAAARFKR